nr:protein ALP1-like isoform X1 [Tanacetum cinerariifolium]
MALDHFCEAVMEIYGPEFLRKPMVTDIEKLYQHHEEKHGFSGIRDHGSNPFILLEAVASQDLWIWHAFFGVAGSNNDINILYQSPLFNDLKTGRAPEIPFVANGVSYPSGYYLVAGIYPELTPLVKTIPEPANDDHNTSAGRLAAKRTNGTSYEVDQIITSASKPSTRFDRTLVS